MPDGVVENQGQPLLFFINDSRLTKRTKDQDEKLFQLNRTLACRGDRAYLAKVGPGKLFVTSVELSKRTLNWKLYHPNTGEALTFFSRLAQGHFEGEDEHGKADFVFNEMLRLLNNCANQLIKINNLKHTDALSLVGRALFFRFLCDRRIISENHTKHIAPHADNLLDCFVNGDNSYDTCRWLDQTFNGDFLPLTDGGSRNFFKNTNDTVFFHLNSIVRIYESISNEDYQVRLPIDWSNFDFAHIPIGLLSQVYEAFCWKWDHKQAKETSILYTPRRIAATLVDEAFDGLPNSCNAHVLDPACGAGVFLVLAFRRLYQERWKTGTRPDTKIIREILENQITGFDISDSALKLSALSLYLTAIELDPDPIPPEKLKFKEMGNRVLFNHRSPKNITGEGLDIGSLGKHVGNKFDNKFDLVLSNPPWTSFPGNKKQLSTELTTVSQAIIKRKGNTKLVLRYQNPDNDPDLPFLWKSTEWCKSGGRIAMALPARILFKQEDIPKRARKTLFQLIDVTGIINGSNLSDTEVWPRMNQPFILLFARNCSPKESQSLKFITPQYDALLNHKGEIRIDSKSTQQIEVEFTFEEPWIWKSLSVGTTLDVEVVRRVKSTLGSRLMNYWKNLGLTNCRGFEKIPSQKQSNARFLCGLPTLDAEYKGKHLVDIEKLEPFRDKEASRPRKREIYRAPLVLVKQSPGFSRERCWALLSFDDVAFSRDYYGYSTADHPQKELLAQYLFLFCHSLIWIHFALMTAPVFGAERRVIYKRDFDECPIVPLEQLNSQQRSTVSILTKSLLDGNMSVFSEIDSFFGNLYGLDELDIEVISDTISVCMPYKESRERACSPPNDGERETFRQRLESVICPFFKVLSKEPQVVVWKPNDAFLKKETPYGIIFIGEQGHTINRPDDLFRNMIIDLADRTGTTSIVQEVQGGLIIGILSQYRYWTPSRARLLGSEIIRQHMSVFED